MSGNRVMSFITPPSTLLHGMLLQIYADVLRSCFLIYIYLYFRPSDEKTSVILSDGRICYLRVSTEKLSNVGFFFKQVIRLVVQASVEVELEVRVYDFGRGLIIENSAQNISYSKSPYSLKRVHNSRRY